MTYSDALFKHALLLLADAAANPELEDVFHRRAVSASYYALFHRINETAVAVIAPNVPEPTRHRIRRWFDHAEMKRICGRFIPARLDQPLRDLIGESASPDLQTVAFNFIQLQDARHRADYDMNLKLTGREAFNFFEAARDADQAWQRIADSAEANIFILSLLLWKNWDKDRA